MSYDDSSLEGSFFLMEPVSETADSETSWDSSKSVKGEELSSQFFSDFGADLTTFYNSTAASGDFLPYGVKAAWKGNDYTGDEWVDGLNLGTGVQVTGGTGPNGETWDVGKGISTYLLEGMGLNADGSTNYAAKVQKFAIILDTGVAEIDNLDGTGDLNVGKFASSNYYDYGSTITSSLGGLSEALDDGAGGTYYTVSQVLSASFVDQNFDSELWNDDPFADGNSHGTHVAGTIAAKADGKGVVGVAPGAEIIAMKVLSDSGGGTFAGVMAGIAQAGDYILQDTYDIKDSAGNVLETIDTSMVTKENTVINMSLGGVGIMQSCLDLIDTYSDQGVVFSLAAGNDSLDVDGITPAAAGDSAESVIIPGSSANTWTVSAVDNKYNNAWFTNFDNDDDNGSNDNSTVSAAGVSVYSYNQGDAGNGMGNLSGTSMAAPAVAGLLLMDPMDIVIDTEGESPIIYSSQWYGQDANGDIDLTNELTTIGSGTNNDFIGIQLGDDALPVGAAPYVDPFALTTLELLGNSDAAYTPEEPMEELPDDGDGAEDDVPDDSPWNGYDPTKSYYDTVGYVNGTNGTYVLSTGYGAASKSTLADTLGIDASDLDGSMLLTANDVSNPGQENDGTKSAIYTTEGSGVKLTGFAEVGDTVGFEYVLSTNDYTPYSDFAFVQVKTGNDSTSNYEVLEISTIGSVGLDLANFGTKVGYFEYTFAEGDFGVDSASVVETEGYYDLSVGVIDAIDTWVDTTLMVKSLGEGGDASEATGTYDSYSFTWDITGLGNAIITNAGGDITSAPVDEVVWNLNTGGAAVSQAAIEITLGGTEFVGDLDTDLNGTKASINATEGSATFADVKGKIGDFVQFDWYFNTTDYAPYKDFSFYTINGEAYKLGALGENVADFGAADGTVSFQLTEAMFDMDNYVAAGNADLDEGGNLLIGFGVMDALDWCVNSNLEISGLKYLDAAGDGFSEPDDEYEGEDAVEDLGSWNFEVFGNYQIFDADAAEGALGADNASFTLAELAAELTTSPDAKYIFDQEGSDPGYELTLSTQWASGDFELVEQSTIEYLSDLDSGFLDTDLDNTKQAINAQSGSLLTLDGVAKAGDIISFDYTFQSEDYIPFQDFAYFTINGKGDTLAEVQYDPGSGTGDATSNDYSGNFTYEVTTSDLGGNLVGEVLVSVGIVNALDNSVASEITLSNFTFTESLYYDENNGFDDSYDYFEIYSIGDVFGDMDQGFALSTGGDTASVAEIENFISNPSGQLDYAPVNLSAGMYFEEDPTLLKTAVNATEGSAIAFCGEAEVGDILSFWYAFETNDYIPFADFSFFTINDTKPIALGALGDEDGNNSYGVVGNVDNWGWTEGYVEIELTEDILDITLTSDGTYYYDLTLGVVDALDTAVDSELFIGGLELLKTGESSDNDYSNVPEDNNGQEDEKSSYYDDYQPGDDSDDAIEGPQLLGNAFFVEEEDAVVLSTGGGAEDQSIVEDILGIKFGELDTTLNGSKEATNATEGSAAYATEQVSAGDVIQFSYTFGTNDYIPYQDFAFVSINGKVNNLATVGVECPDFDEISDVFNYVVSKDDLGGNSEGLVKIAIGIMDSTDTWVDSYIEIYDFSISDEELVNDASGSGIISGAGVYSINTSTFEDDFTGFSSATAKAVKINFNGDSLEEDESSYDIIASAKGIDNNANGYQILLKGSKDTKNADKYNVYQTDSFGEVQKSGKLGWKSLTKAVDLGLENTFGIDLDGDSILSSGYSEGSNSLTLFSSTNGAVELTEKSFNTSTGTIDQTSLDTSTLNIVAATPAKSDFNTFSTNASVYQVLIAGSGANAGKYQKWQADSDGVIIDKNDDWKTASVAVSEGWELTFDLDFDGDGLISGDTVVKMLSDTGPKVLKNIKGSAFELSVDYGYEIVGSLADKNGNFDIVVQGNSGGLYEDQWAIWKASQTGKVSSEGTWISTSDLLDAGYEQQYDFDFTGDGFKGELDKTIGSDSSGLGVALSGGKYGMIVSADSSTVSNITSGKKNKNYKITKNSSLVAAEELTGAYGFEDGTYAVITNTKQKHIQLLSLDSNYNILSKSKIKNNSDKYLQLESAFATDFNADGITASLIDDIYFSGSVSLASNSAGITLDYVLDSDGGYSAVLDWSAADASDQPAGALGTSSVLLDAKGKPFSLSGAWTFDSFAIQDTTSDLLTFFTNKNGTKIKTFAFDWAGANGYIFDKVATKSNKVVKSGSSDFFAKESTLGIDFDGDGNTGTGSFYVYNNTDIGSLAQSTDGLFTANVGSDDVTLTEKNGNVYFDKGSYKISAVADENATDGTFEALMVNSKNSSIKVYTFNDDGSLLSKKSSTAKVGSALFYEGESIFELDIDGDSIIGLDTNSDDTFDASDTLAPVETQSATSLVFDIAGTAYANTDSLDEIVLGGKAKKGFNIVGAESFDTDGDGFFENYAMTSNKKGTKFFMYVLGEDTADSAADWDQDSDISSITGVSKSISKFTKKSVGSVEYIFNQDFNGSTSIGT